MTTIAHVDVVLCTAMHGDVPQSNYRKATKRVIFLDFGGTLIGDEQ